MNDRLAQLQKLHAADPADPFLTYGIALELAKTGDEEDAIAWLDKTLALDAQYCYAYFQKGRILADLGQIEQAKATLETGIRAATAAGDTHAASEIQGLLTSI